MSSTNVTLAAVPNHASAAPRAPETTTLTADEIRRIVHDIVG